MSADIEFPVAKPANDKERRIQHAFKLALETQNHADEWYAQAAWERQGELLQNASPIRDNEANRLLRGTKLEKEYKELADYARDSFGHNPDGIINLLRKADQMPYRLLEEVTKLKEEEMRKEPRW